MKYEDYVARVDNYPEEGIVFRDITPLMADGEVYKSAIKEIVNFVKDMNIDVIVGPEARGFIIGCPLAYELGIGFVPVRKKGKLPRETIEVDYDLEYGSNILQIHKDAIKPGQRVLLADDLLATGGTMGASIELVEKLGGVVVGCAFLIELDDLKGREKLQGHDYFT